MKMTKEYRVVILGKGGYYIESYPFKSHKKARECYKKLIKNSKNAFVDLQRREVLPWKTIESRFE